MKNIFQYSAEKSFTKFVWEIVETNDSTEIQREDVEASVQSELKNLKLTFGKEQITKAGAEELKHFRKELREVRNGISELSDSEKIKLEIIETDIESREQELWGGTKKGEARQYLNLTQEKVDALDLSTLDFTKPEALNFTLNDIEQKVFIAKDKARAFPEFSGEISDLEILFKEKRSAIEKAEGEIKVLTKEILDKRNEQQKKYETVEQEMKSKMEAMIANMAETPEELIVNELPEFNENNLESFQGVSEEYLKHQMHSNILNQEIAVMESGVYEFDEEFQALEAAKYELDANTIGATLLVGGAYAVGASVAAGLTAATGGFLGFLAPAIIGATGYAVSKASTALGFGDPEKYEVLKGKQKTIQQAFNEKSPKLSQKQEELETRGEKIERAVSAEGALAQSADDMRIKFTEIEAQLRADGVPEALIAESKEKLEASVKTGIDNPLATVKASIDDPASGIGVVTKLNQNSIVNLAASHQYIEQDLNIEPPTIMDKTLGAIGTGVSWMGDKLEKVDHPLIQVIGGAIDGVGELVAGLGALVDNPQNLIALAGFDPSGKEDWPHGWMSLWDGITAKEERLEDNNWAAGGKISFNVVAMLFGGPKRGLAKLKGFKRGASKTAFGKAAGTKFKGIIEKPFSAVKKIMPKRGPKLPRVEALTKKISGLTDDLAKLEGQGFIRRYFSKGKRAKMAIDIENLKIVKDAAIKEVKASAKTSVEAVSSTVPSAGARASVRITAAEKLLEKVTPGKGNISKAMLEEARAMFPKEKSFTPSTMSKKMYRTTINDLIKKTQKQARLEWAADVPVVAVAMNSSEGKEEVFTDMMDSEDIQYTEKDLRDARKFFQEREK